jgi:hypothetical protein
MGSPVKDRTEKREAVIVRNCLHTARAFGRDGHHYHRACRLGSSRYIAL